MKIFIFIVNEALIREMPSHNLPLFRWQAKWEITDAYTSSYNM